jgi:hypothetical protein
MGLREMSHRTEASYLHYIVDFIRFHGKRHARELGVGERSALTCPTKLRRKTEPPPPRTWPSRRLSRPNSENSVKAKFAMAPIKMDQDRRTGSKNRGRPGKR